MKLLFVVRARVILQNSVRTFAYGVAHMKCPWNTETSGRRAGIDRTNTQKSVYNT